MSQYDLIIIGGGPSGLTAAITAKNNGTNTAILEGNDRVGKKILSTGNGLDHNITNSHICGSNYHSKNPYFFKTVLQAFTVEDTINYFSSLGLPLTTLEDGKMFHVFTGIICPGYSEFSIDEKNISVLYNSKVRSIKKIRNYFQIKTKR